MSMTKEDKEIIDLKFKGLKAEIRTNHDMEMQKIEANHGLQMQKLENILNQAMNTNGRVTKVEKETRTVRFFARQPIMLILVIIGILFLLSMFDLPTIIKFFI